MNLLRNGSMTTGIAMGVGFFLLAPVAARMLSGAGRPLLKEAMKGGLHLYQQSRTMLAEAKETLEDISAEARAEMTEAKELPSGSKK